MNRESCIFVDGHVHMHPGFNTGQALDSAARNLESASKLFPHCGDSVGVLLLAEMHGHDWFGTTRTSVLNGNTSIDTWSIDLSNEPETLIACSDVGRRKLLVIAGRQIVTAERIEVLALLTPRHFPDGLSIDATLAAAHAAGALVVLPWGVGKWFGQRGRLVRRALSRHTSARPVLAGDNGGRPWCWPRPRIFAAAELSGAPVLPGTDPLPLPNQETRIGSFGLAFAGHLPLESPAAALRSWLIEPSSRAPARLFGKPERVSRFLHNQIRLRIRPEVVQ
jgi:hypothetical protein